MSFGTFGTDSRDFRPFCLRDRRDETRAVMTDMTYDVRAATLGEGVSVAYVRTRRSVAAVCEVRGEIMAEGAPQDGD